MLKSFVDGTFTKDVDFEFTINDNTFHHCWLLVDGIYPELSRFVKTIDEPRGQGTRIFASWQEASRKDIERAFGVIQRKFQIGYTRAARIMEQLEEAGIVGPQSAAGQPRDVIV